MSESDANQSEDFIRLLTDHQANIRAYLIVSIGPGNHVNDLVQNVNLTLWRKASEFRSGASFLPWALAVARYEVLAYLRDRRREKLVFSSHVSELMLEVANEEALTVSDTQLALVDCLQTLSDRNRDLLSRRYARNEPTESIAEVLNRSSNAVRCMLLRIRKALAECIERKMSAESIR